MSTKKVLFVWLSSTALKLSDDLTIRKGDTFTDAALAKAHPKKCKVKPKEVKQVVKPDDQA